MTKEEKKIRNQLVNELFDTALLGIDELCIIAGISRTTFWNYRYGVRSPDYATKQRFAEQLIEHANEIIEAARRVLDGGTGDGRRQLEQQGEDLGGSLEDQPQVRD